MQCRLYPVCIKTDNPSTMNEYHIAKAHNIDIIPYKAVFDAIKEFYLHQIEKIKKSKDIMKRLKKGVFIEINGRKNLGESKRIQKSNSKTL